MLYTLNWLWKWVNKLINWLNYLFWYKHFIILIKFQKQILFCYFKLATRNNKKLLYKVFIIDHCKKCTSACYIVKYPSLKTVVSNHCSVAHYKLLCHQKFIAVLQSNTLLCILNPLENRIIINQYAFLLMNVPQKFNCFIVCCHIKKVGNHYPRVSE